MANFGEYTVEEMAKLTARNLDLKNLPLETLNILYTMIADEIDRKENDTKRELWGKLMEAFEEYVEKVEPITILLPNDEAPTFNKADIENLLADYGVIDATI